MDGETLGRIEWIEWIVGGRLETTFPNVFIFPITIFAIFFGQTNTEGGDIFMVVDSFGWRGRMFLWSWIFLAKQKGGERDSVAESKPRSQMYSSFPQPFLQPFLAKQTRRGETFYGRGFFWGEGVDRRLDG